MRPPALGLAAWITAGTTLLAACSPDPHDSGQEGPSAPVARPLRPACRLELATRGQPESVRLFDLDGDGRDELYAVTRGAPTPGGGTTGTLHVWRGPFEPPRVVELPDYLLGPEALDGGLVVASRVSSELIRLDADLEQVERRAIPGVPRALAVGPPRPDGPQRVVVATREGELCVTTGDAWTSTRLPARLATTLFVEPGAIWVGSQETLALYRCDPAPTAIDLGGIPRDIGRFDLDGDGTDELCVAGGEHELWTIEGQAATALEVGSIPIALARAGDGLACLGFGELSYRVLAGHDLVHRAYAGQDAWDLATGDLDGDGALDLALANRGASRVSVVLGDGGGGFLEAERVESGLGPHRIGAIDLDGDGRRELLSVDALDDVLSAMTVGGPARRQTWGLEGGVQALRVADVDGVPGEEVLLAIEAGAGGRLEVWRPVEAQPGRHVLRRVAQLELPGPPGDLAPLPRGPFGAARIALADRRGGLWWLPWSDGAPGPPRPIALDGVPTCMAVTGRHLTVGLGAPGARCGLAVVGGADADPVAFLDLANLSPVDLVAYDHDGDGDPELAALLRPEGADGPGRLALLRWEAGNWRPFHSEPTGLRPFAVAAGDLDGDGRDELVVGAQNSHHVNLWTPREGGLTRLPDLGVGLGVLDVAVVDLDGDGWREVVCANNFSRDLSVVRMR